MTAEREPAAADADVRPPRPLRPDPRPAMSQLLTQRGDLRGVYATADYLAESIRWSA
jgi:hypothetical protein